MLTLPVLKKVRKAAKPKKIFSKKGLSGQLENTVGIVPYVEGIQYYSRHEKQGQPTFDSALRRMLPLLKYAEPAFASACSSRRSGKVKELGLVKACID